MSEAFINHGACSWIELHTKDKRTSKEFYSQLFGWNIQDMGMPDGSCYSVINLGEQGIGGIVESDASEPTNSGWGMYITVDSVDAVQDKVFELGGSILVPAFDAPGVGRIAKIADPAGAQLSVITYAAPEDIS